MVYSFLNKRQQKINDEGKSKSKNQRKKIIDDVKAKIKPCQMNLSSMLIYLLIHIDLSYLLS